MVLEKPEGTAFWLDYPFRQAYCAASTLRHVDTDAAGRHNSSCAQEVVTLFWPSVDSGRVRRPQAVPRPYRSRLHSAIKPPTDAKWVPILLIKTPTSKSPMPSKPAHLKISATLDGADPRIPPGRCWMATAVRHCKPPSRCAYLPGHRAEALMVAGWLVALCTLSR